jgi:type IV conjugative transfer system coupling protein TraD
MVAKELIGGGQTWAHRVRMLRQILKIAWLTSLAIALIIFALELLSFDPVLFESTFYRIKAEVSLVTNSSTKVSSSYYKKVTNISLPRDTSLNSKELISKTKPHVDLFIKKLLASSVLSAKWFFCSFPLILVFFFVRGKSTTKSKVVTGHRIQNAWKTNLYHKITRKASVLKIGNIHLLKDSETKHILITGCTGSGKTNAIHSFLKTLDLEKSKAVIVDTTGEFVSRYYKKQRDYILNPFSNEHAKWSPWKECSNIYEFDNLAKSFIPYTNNPEDAFWRSAARSLFSSLLQRHQKKENIDFLIEEMLYSSLTSLFKSLKGTKAAAYIDPSSERTAGSIRSVASSFLEPLELIKDKTGEFSIKKWMKESDRGVLFISSSPEQRASLTPLLSSWFSIALASLMKLPINRERRVWFIVDELASLHHIPDLEMFVTESRKFGGCGLLATQSLSQLDDIYGKSAQTIIGNISTRVVFAEKNPVLAKRTSEIFGENEEISYQESLSYGANDIRDGVNLSHSKKITPTVNSSLIQNLKPNNGFIYLDSKNKISKLKTTFIS